MRILYTEFRQDWPVTVKIMDINVCTYTFMIISRSVLLRMKKFSKWDVEKIKTHILCSITFFFRKSCRLWDDVEKYYRAWQATDDNIMRRRRIACWIPKATNPHSGCVILITFPLRWWLQAHALMLHYKYIACPVIFHYYQSWET